MNENHNEIGPESEPPKRMEPSLLFAIVLLAAGLFNLPTILKKPVSDADWMMLVIVLALIGCGLLLLILPNLIRKK